MSDGIRALTPSQRRKEVAGRSLNIAIGQDLLSVNNAGQSYISVAGSAVFAARSRWFIQRATRFRGKPLA